MDKSTIFNWGLHSKAYNEADNAAGFGELTFHDL